ncbi:bifunctional 3-(3-hydroxy-phenyl)propionate/3-hydroxycinnamic acid hydroxylase MhpA [Nocardia amikacinitolerans]|uniref:bifunctional 3-(3-hydroxy-phenyl)propionate/3-hydroxycinnamic acid hydroxylase MhpA n=1 Tax=Nocardia amikacinitolerans TaxID=756689 RepID=UPI000832DD24|nr:bifunctional 3-(3-hydroxy-phenyl)propionate/3-hydroxycinnamic acid hydroxylase [Nocardia amikacinitolerans]MCP2281006.1 flavoprotein hydroxylase [Nocardia amikacinitolerans]MCP2320166.1 flavoprotein hydroxylase [Nocardia amikacinitolerans]
MSNKIHDVAIVGFGPVGQLLAILLGRRGHDVVVLERWPQPYDKPRAVHFDHEIGRIFQAAGISDEVMAITDPVPDFYEWRNREGDALVRIDWSGTGESGWPTANFFSQPELERVLAKAAEALPTVTVRRGTEVSEVSEHPGHVDLTACDGTRIAARWVIGADGANSLVRRHMPTATTDLGFFFDWLIVDTVPHEQRDWSPMNWQLCDPARPTTIVSGGPGRRRWEFMRLPGETVADLDTVETAWKLLEPWGRHPGNTTLERHTVYTFQARWVDTWRAGRLLLAGDAAHLMPPFAGQGMCSGLRDALNLSWKLDLVLRGTAHPDLLDTYSSERSAHVRHAIDMSIALGEVICVLDEQAAAQRDRRMIAGGADPAQVLPAGAPPVLGDGVLQCLPDGRRAGAVGHLSPQYRVRHGDTTAPLDDLTGFGFTVLIDGLDLSVLSPEHRLFLDDIGATLVPLTSDPSDTGYTDIDHGYLPHMREHRHVAAIVRPDFYLFGTAHDATELADLIDQLRVQLRIAH